MARYDDIVTTSQLDMLSRAGGAVLLLFVAAILLRDDRRQMVARLFAPLALCLSAFILTNSSGPELVTGRLETGLNLLSGWTVPFLWWFCLSTFDRSFRVRGVIAWTGVAWIVVATVNRGWLGVEVPAWLGTLSSVGFGLAIVAHLVWRLLADQRDDLIDRRRRLRPLIALFLVAQLFIDLVIDLFLGVEWQRDWFALGQNLSLIAFIASLGWLSLRSGVLHMFDEGHEPADGGKQRPAASDQRLATIVSKLIDDERVFLDPELTFANFAARTGFSERSVRHHIHHDLGFDHFRSFLNAHRVADACRRLNDPAHGADKLITIAFDSGFASLASFNRIFLAVTGRTPSDYRKNREAARIEERLANF